MNLNEDQILALAPDEASKKSGKDLANSKKWNNIGICDKALWGECQGSGSKPYQTQIDLINIAFKCSCPSRKFPCKHGLGLLIYHSRNNADFSNKSMPAWVEDWIEKRSVKKEKKSEEEQKPIDEEARTKRQQARAQKVDDGIEELLIWLKDIVRNGILSIPEKGSIFFENMARRMVDAQAQGIAGMIRGMGEINFYKENWQGSFLDHLVNIYVIAKAYQNHSALPEMLQLDIKTQVGFLVNQEELKEQSGVVDDWLILTKQVSEIDNITTEKYWLHGAESNLTSTILQFIVSGQGRTVSLMPGMMIKAELVFFPSVIPQRAIIKRQINTDGDKKVDALENLSEVAKAETEMNSKLPVRGDSVFIVNNLRPVQNTNGAWSMADDAGNMIQLKNEQKYIWTVLALNGGIPSTTVLLGREGVYEIVGVWVNNQYKPI